MHLWNDYEGRTLAGVFMLERLLRTEGRSASFATRDRAGRAVVIRLTEALNDQEQMRERYRAVQAAAHKHLVAIEDYGDAELDGTPLIYLVSELTEESLAEVLPERRLSIEETGEVAASLVSAVETLHEHGLIHGRVEPSSVLAVGQVIKLRTDCVRVAEAGEEGESARGRDVFGVADTLHRALTQQPLEDASDALALPEPYAAIVRNVVRGTWGLEEVASELRRSLRAANLPGVVQAPPSIDVPVASPVTNVEPIAKPLAVAEPEGVRAGEGVSAGRAKARAGSASAAQMRLDYEAAKRESLLRAREDVPSQAPGIGRKVLVVAGGMAAVLLIAVPVWRSVSTPSVDRAAAPPLAASATPSASQPVPVAPTRPTAARPPSPPSNNSAGDGAAATGDGRIWRVVAYTYNREDQAQAKVRFLMQRHAGLRPEVFSRTGGAPYLVVLGGALSQAQAAAIRQQALGEGLAQDVYMQNYSK